MTYLQWSCFNANSTSLKYRMWTKSKVIRHLKKIEILTKNKQIELNVKLFLDSVLLHWKSPKWTEPAIRVNDAVLLLFISNTDCLCHRYITEWQNSVYLYIVSLNIHGCMCYTYISQFNIERPWQVLITIIYNTNDFKIENLLAQDFKGCSCQ